MKKSHSKLVSEILLDLQSNFEGRFFERNIGKVKMANGRWLSFGIPGQADIYGFVLIRVADDVMLPVAFECEVKVGSDKLRPKQVAWRDICRAYNVIYILGTGSKQVVRELNKYVPIKSHR